MIANPKADIQLTSVDESFVHVGAGDDTFQELSDFFTFKPPNWQWHPKVKAKVWDGSIRLLSHHTNLIYKGLQPYIIKFAQDRGYTCSYDDETAFDTTIDKDKLDKWIDSLDLHSADSKSDTNPEGRIIARPTQRFCVRTLLHEYRATFVSPTATGKSLIAYLVTRYLTEIKNARKILLVVPTVGLVQQMYNDFKDYSLYNGWNAEKNCHMIYEGQTKETLKPIVISTWQSIYSLPEEWFEDFEVIIGDEAHKWQAKCLRIILESAVNAKWRMGMTGTLSDSKVHKLILEGLFGKIYSPENTDEIKSTKTGNG